MTPDLPPSFSWATMVPELVVTDLEASLRFWCGLCGFSVAYARPAEGFAYLDRGGRQVMLEEGLGGRWQVGEMERPFGRGVNFQIDVPEIGPIVEALVAAGWPSFCGPEERWYRAGTRETGVWQVLVQDPDGYLVRFSQALGLRDYA